MKIRKSILAAATAATVSVSGVVAAPAFAADPAPKDDTNVTAEGKDKPKGEETDEDNTEQEKSFGQKLKDNSSDSDGQWDPKQITAWIAVFTAVLGLIGSVLTFAQKNFKLPKF